VKEEFITSITKSFTFVSLQPICQRQVVISLLRKSPGKKIQIQNSGCISNHEKMIYNFKAKIPSLNKVLYLA
jgi:hypothetical protein